ncbi:MAG TPA: hypothetical protein VF193_17515 [Steroidobacter sp.]
MRAAKILGVNLLVLAGLLLAAEVGYRAVKLAGSCLSAKCDVSYLELGYKFRRNVEVGFSRIDPVVGHVPSDGDHFIRGPAGEPKRVTIRDGFRVSGSQAPQGPATLAVGDSFTFGDEVSDEDTWPACLQERWATPVLNGGVFGYGAAQAVLRARELERSRRFERIIWSVLVDEDFERDALVSRSNMPKPAVIRDGNGMRFTSIEESKSVLVQTSGTGLAKYASGFGYFYLSKLTWQHFSPLVLRPGTTYDGRWTVSHPEAAGFPELLSFSVAQFAALRAPEKFILLQYDEPTVRSASPRAKAEIEALKSLSRRYGLAVIDTLPALKGAPDLDSLYSRHHTPAGNRLVCDVIDGAVKSATAQQPATADPAASSF